MVGDGEGEAVGKVSAGCLCCCWGTTLPPSLAPSFPTSLARSELSIHACIQQSLKGPAGLLMAGELRKLLQLHSWVLCLAATSQGGRIPAEKQGEEMSFLPTAAGRADILPRLGWDS